MTKDVKLKTTLMKEKDEEITNLKTLVEADESELKVSTLISLIITNVMLSRRQLEPTMSWRAS